MKISSDAIIPEEKLTRYLLVPKPQDDKSKFLAQAGFTQDNPAELLSAIRQLAESIEAAEDGNNEYGIFIVKAICKQQMQRLPLQTINIMEMMHMVCMTGRLITLWQSLGRRLQEIIRELLCLWEVV